MALEGSEPVGLSANGTLIDGGGNPINIVAPGGSFGIVSPDGTKLLTITVGDNESTAFTFPSGAHLTVGNGGLQYTDLDNQLELDLDPINGLLIGVNGSGVFQAAPDGNLHGAIGGALTFTLA